MDNVRMYHWIVNELGQRRPVADSMSRLVDECETIHPHPDWARLRTLAYADVAPLVRWVERSFRDDFPPERPLKGLWFGICYPIRNGEAVADLYITGSERFDPEDFTWATRPEWRPLYRYAESVVLADVYRIDLGNYPLCLGYGVFAMREVLNQIGPALVLGESPSIGVGVGFNGGDWISLGEFGPSGFTN